MLDFVLVPSSHDKVTIHRVCIERILKENVKLYTSRPIMHRSSRFVDSKLDVAADAEYPLRVIIESLSARNP